MCSLLQRYLFSFPIAPGPDRYPPRARTNRSVFRVRTSSGCHPGRGSGSNVIGVLITQFLRTGLESPHDVGRNAGDAQAATGPRRGGGRASQLSEAAPSARTRPRGRRRDGPAGLTTVSRYTGTSIALAMPETSGARDAAAGVHAVGDHQQRPVPVRPRGHRLGRRGNGIVQ